MRAKPGKLAGDEQVRRVVGNKLSLWNLVSTGGCTDAVDTEKTLNTQRRVTQSNAITDSRYSVNSELKTRQFQLQPEPQSLPKYSNTTVIHDIRAVELLLESVLYIYLSVEVTFGYYGYYGSVTLGLPMYSKVWS